MPYAILFFSEGLHSALTTLLQSSDLQVLLGDQDAQKAEIQDHLKHSLKLFESFLKLSGR